MNAEADRSIDADARERFSHQIRATLLTRLFGRSFSPQAAALP